MKKGWLDSHCHLADEKLIKDIDEIMERAKVNNVQRVLTVAGSLKEAYESLKIQNKYDNIDLLVGFHPGDADEITQEDLVELEEFIKTNKVLGIGEIGLDYYWRKDNKDKQKDLFIKQLELANKYELPISLHIRDSIQDVYDILKEKEVAKKGILHCYSGSVEMAEEFLKLGYYISLAGVVTFKNAKVSKEVAEVVPLERILIETDAPYLTPEPYRGKRNEPAYVMYTGQEIAMLRGISEEELQEALINNYQRLFDL